MYAIQQSNIRSLSVVLSCLLIVLAPLTAWAEGPTSAEYGVVLNLSGKQRMLTQKMSKEIMLVALGVDAEANLGNLEKTAGLFDKTLKGLRDGSDELRLPPTSSGRILRQLDKIDGIWATFYPVVQDILQNKGVSKEQVALVAKTNLPLLKQMNKAVGLYEKDAKKGGLKGAPGLAATINLAGKQRALRLKQILPNCLAQLLLLQYFPFLQQPRLFRLEQGAVCNATGRCDVLGSIE